MLRWRFAALLALAIAGCGPGLSPLDKGIVMLSERDYEAARQHFTDMVAENPDDPYANLNLGVAHAKLGDKVAASRYYRVAVRTGRSAEIKTVVAGGAQEQRSTTVAALAARNLDLLGGI